MEAVRTNERSQPNPSSRPSLPETLPPCPRCGGAGLLFRVPRGETLPIYPLGTNLADVSVSCPICSAETRRPWLAKYSGLEPHELAYRLHHWRCAGFKGAPPEWLAQRRVALEAMEGTIARPAGLYTFWGDFGSGKTLAQQIVINELREGKLIEGFYAPFAVILDHLRQLWASKQDSSAFWDRLLNIPVLALDEVTRFDSSKEWAQEKLFNLVDTRYRKERTHLTLFGTNDDPTVTLTTDDPVGYLFSRMRQGTMLLLEGDLRQAIGGQQ